MISSKKTLIKKPSKKPWTWTDKGKQLKSENRPRIGTWNIITLKKSEDLQYVHDAIKWTY